MKMIKNKIKKYQKRNIKFINNAFKYNFIIEVNNRHHVWSGYHPYVLVEP